MGPRHGSTPPPSAGGGDPTRLDPSSVRGRRGPDTARPFLRPWQPGARHASSPPPSAAAGDPTRLGPSSVRGSRGPDTARPFLRPWQPGTRHGSAPPPPAAAGDPARLDPSSVRGRWGRDIGPPISRPPWPARREASGDRRAGRLPSLASPECDSPSSVHVSSLLLCSLWLDRPRGPRPRHQPLHPRRPPRLHAAVRKGRRRDDHHRVTCRHCGRRVLTRNSGATWGHRADGRMCPGLKTWDDSSSSSFSFSSSSSS